MFFLRKSSPFLIMIAVAAATWRLHLSGRILEYDEIWTLENFARLNAAEIFSSFATPNNHPFNTLWVKLSAAWSAGNLDMRLASMIFTCGAMIFGGLIARRIYGKCAGLYTMLAMALLPPFLAAGSTARGYAGQLFLLTLFTYSLLRCRKGNIFWTLVAAASAVAATVSLPSSILFLAPVGGFFLGTMLEKRKLCRVHLYAFGAAVAFALWWYAKNWNAFLETQKFAVPLNNSTDICNWLKDVCCGTAMLLPVMLAVIYIRRDRMITWGVALTVAFPLLMAYVSGAAPARVYLPCAAAAAILCAPPVYRFRKIWFVIALAAQFCLSLPAYPGDRALETAVKNAAAADLNVFTPTDSYIVQYNYPELCQNIPKRLRAVEQKEEITLTLVKNNGKISGIDHKYQTVEWTLPGKYARAAGNTTLRLRRTDVLQPMELGIIVLPPMIEQNITWAFRRLRGMKIIKLNAWMAIPLDGIKGEKLRYELLAVKAPAGRILPKNIPLYTIID